MIRLLFLFVFIFSQTYCQIRVVTTRQEKKSDVNRDLEEFLNLLPADNISLLVQEYAKEDKEVQDNWRFLQSPEAHTLIKNIEESAEFIKILQHLQQAGIDIPIFMTHIHRLLVRVPPPGVVVRKGLGLKGMLDDIRAMIPESKIKLLSTQKFIFSSEFRGLIRTITSRPFKNDMQKLVTSQPVKKMEEQAIRNKVNVEAIYEFIASFQFLYEYLIDL